MRRGRAARALNHATFAFLLALLSGTPLPLPLYINVHVIVLKSTLVIAIVVGAVVPSLDISSFADLRLRRLR